MVNNPVKGKKSAPRNSSNREWIDSLTYPVSEQALKELRKILVRALKPALSKYVDRELDQFVEDVAQDALLKVLENIDSFRGESKLTSWAITIAIREGLTVLRRKRWQNISLNSLAGDQNEKEGGEIRSNQFSSNDPSPDDSAHTTIVMDQIMQIIGEELSEKQKMAMVAVKIHDMPMTAVADKMGVKRNALYKLLYDARKSLKARMKQKGINPETLLQSM